jgi:membrane peptidoglycan carboxypeptidase
MVTGASTLATMGVRHMPAPVVEIQDSLGHPLYTYDPNTNSYRAISPQVSYIIASIMSDDRNRCMEFGCGGDLTLAGRHVAAKTGTTNDFRDNWTVGFTPTLATAVWVGNPDNKPLSHNSTGIVGAAPIWHRFMLNALKGVPDRWYDTPSGITRSGDNVFISGTESLAPTLAQKWPVCKFKTYNPYTVSASDLTVDGVPCVLPQPDKKPTQPNPDDQQTPCPPRLDRRMICILPTPSPSP